MKKVDAGVENLFMFNVTCAKCNQISKAPDLFCSACGGILPFYTMNPFMVFRLTPCLNMDRKVLDQYYFDIQRKLHPDKLRNVSELEKLWAEQHIAQINQAYKILQDHLLAAKASVLYIQNPLLGLEKFNEHDVPTPPMGFLQKIMALQINNSSEESDQLYQEVMFNLNSGINDLDKNEILTAIAKLTYVQRLRNLTKEAKHADSNY